MIYSTVYNSKRDFSWCK